MTFVVTLSGREIELLAPKVSDIDIHDIAVGLARCARFTGQTYGEYGYSVAQHSELVSRIVPPEFALAALLHDAAEAYVRDLTTPVKELVSGFDTIEHGFLTVILTRFGLPETLPPCVKKADRIALATERRDLVPATPTPWASIRGIEALPERIVPLHEHAARDLFLGRFHELTNNGWRTCSNG